MSFPREEMTEVWDALIKYQEGVVRTAKEELARSFAVLVDRLRLEKKPEVLVIGSVVSRKDIVRMALAELIKHQDTLEELKDMVFGRSNQLSRGDIEARAFEIYQENRQRTVHQFDNTPLGGPCKHCGRSSPQGACKKPKST